MKSVTIETLAMTAAVISLNLFPSLATAQGGYNGPDLSGESIPIQLDRAINYLQVKRAYEACMPVFLKPLFEEIFKRPAEKTASGEKVYTYSPSYEDGINFIDQFGIDLGSHKPFSDNVRIHVGTKYDRLGALDVESYHLTPGEGLNSGLWVENLTNNMLTAPNGIPYLTYSTVAPEPRYDEMGDLIIAQDSEWLVQNLQLVLPVDYGPAVALINSDTKRPTPVTVNMVQYADCLRAEIQK